MAKFDGVNAHADFKVGDIVLFGRERGQKTRGEVIKVNRKSLKVKQLEHRGTRKAHEVGTTWKVHPSLCSKVVVDSLHESPAAPVVRDLAAPPPDTNMDELFDELTEGDHG